MKSVTTIIKNQWLKIFFLVLFSFYILVVAQAGAPPLVNYQGKLTDADGKPLAGSHKLSFSIYTAETDGTQVWGPQVFNDVSIIDGYFNVILRSDTDGRSISDAFASENAYLEITIGDGPPLPTRQRILSAPYAIQADKATKADRAMMNGVPPGAIVMWSGSIGDIPDGWALCDGNLGTPDLLDRFILGTVEGEDPGETGGASSYALSIEQLPSHTHTGSTGSAGSHSHSGSTTSDGSHSHQIPIGNVDDFNFTHKGGQRPPADGDKAYWTGVYTANSGSHNHSVSTNSSGSHTHSITINPTGSESSIDNRPAFYKLAFIMKL
jgi:microcystin-dependent protein